MYSDLFEKIDASSEMKDNKTIISCIITTADRPSFFSEAILSVIEQSYKQIEIIVIDDSINERNSIEVKKVISSIPENYNIKYYHVAMRHAGKMRNFGVSLSKGQYICFLDDDDFWEKTKLEEQIAIFSNSNEKLGIVYCWVKYFSDVQKSDVKYRNPNIEGNIFKHLIAENSITMTSSLMISKEAFISVNGFDENFKIGQDTELIRSIAINYTVRFVANYLVSYRVDHDFNQMKSTYRYLLNDMYMLILKKYSHYLSTYPNEFAFLYFNLFINSLSNHHYLSSIKYFITSLKTASNKFFILIKFLKYLIKPLTKLKKKTSTKQC